MTLMIAFALDPQEVTFIKQNLGLSDSVYGVIVSLTGVGAIIGGIVAAALTTKISLKGYIGYGLFFTMLLLHIILLVEHIMAGCIKFYPARLFYGI